jgi:heptaprenyl diphosphate synthase
MAFQIIDDILDYTGNEELVRKPLGNDITAGLITLPVLCALPLNKVLQEIFSKETFTFEDSKNIFNLVRESGGVEAAGKYAEVYTNRAIREIDSLPKGSHRDMLATLARQLLIREN